MSRMNESNPRRSLATRGRSTAPSLVLVISGFACSCGSSAHRSDAGSDAAAAPSCGPIEAPGTARCPPECTGGCDADHVCTIECSGPGTCSGDVITCPPDYACLVRCVGLDACDSGTIRCPDSHACTLVCDGVDGCGDQSVQCGRGGCSVRCGANPEACTGMNVHCGAGPCSASCEGTSAPNELVGCADSCSCTQCPARDMDAGADAAAGADASAGPDACDSDRCIASAAPTSDEVRTWVDEYRAAHPGNGGMDWDINAKTPAVVAMDPDAQRLLSICGTDQRPVIPLLAWEYGGSDHAWIHPEASALVYCVYTPVAPSSEHWSFAANHVVADLYVLFPDDNPCRDRVGADQVAGCIGDASNFEILVDIASRNDGHDVGLELSEASTELRLVLPTGGPAIHLYDGV